VVDARCIWGIHDHYHSAGNYYFVNFVNFVDRSFVKYVKYVNFVDRSFVKYVKYVNFVDRSFVN
jgi:hypothetical protein